MKWPYTFQHLLMLQEKPEFVLVFLHIPWKDQKSLGNMRAYVPMPWEKLHLIVQCRMYTTEIDPDLVSRFIPLSYSIFPRFRLKRIRPEPGIVSPRLLVTCSLACSLDPKDATDPNIQQRQRKCKYKHTPFGFPMQDTLQNKQKREQMTDGHEKKRQNASTTVLRRKRRAGSPISASPQLSWQKCWKSLTMQRD